MCVPAAPKTHTERKRNRNTHTETAGDVSETEEKPRRVWTPVKHKNRLESASFPFIGAALGSVCGRTERPAVPLTSTRRSEQRRESRVRYGSHRRPSSGQQTPSKVFMCDRQRMMFWCLCANKTILFYTSCDHRSGSVKSTYQLKCLLIEFQPIALKKMYFKKKLNSVFISTPNT